MTFVGTLQWRVPFTRWRVTVSAAALLFAFAITGTAQRRDAFVQSRNHPAIAYGTTPADDAVARLNQRLRDGKVKLTYNEDNGYLQSLLDALEIPVESQTLVFSQTSFQAPLINVKQPACDLLQRHGLGRLGARRRPARGRGPGSPQGVIFYSLAQKPPTRRSSSATTTAWPATCRGTPSACPA